MTVCDGGARELDFAVYGMYTPRTAETVTSLAQQFHIPYVTGSRGARDFTPRDFVINLRPDVSLDMAKIMKQFRWATVYYLYDSSYGTQKHYIGINNTII